MFLIHEVAEGERCYQGINWWKPTDNPTLFRLIINIGHFRIYFRIRDMKYFSQVKRFIFKIGIYPNE